MSPTFFDTTEWYKYWGGNWSILTCSYWGVQYTGTFHIGRHPFLEKTVIMFDGKNSAAYAPQTDRKRYGTYLARQLQSNEAYVHIWTEQLKIETDRIRSFMSSYKNQEIPFSVWSEFLDLMHDYYFPHIKVKNVVDWISPELLTKYLPVFQEARVYAEPVFAETEEFTEQFAKHVARRERYSTDSILCLLSSELDMYEKNGILPPESELLKRTTAAMLVERGKVELLTGDDACEVQKKILPQMNTNSISGVSAYPGRVQGRARIVTDPSAVTEFADGDILIASMTRPEFLPLMKKAAAIVTDSGGILCHAAIVARELKKPCVIATQVATIVFSDGDIVEVDANNGVVRKA